jgi:hypothetical protein
MPNYRKIVEQKKEDLAKAQFQEALENGMRIRQMTKQERKTGVVKIRMKPKRKKGAK